MTLWSFGDPGASIDEVAAISAVFARHQFTLNRGVKNPKTFGHKSLDVFNDLRGSNIRSVYNVGGQAVLAAGQHPYMQIVNISKSAPPKG